MDVDVQDRREQRKFGITIAVALVVLALLRWGFHWWRSGAMPEFPWWFLAVAAVFVLPALAYPPVLMPVFWVWMKLALALNWVMTRVLLTLAFFLILLPSGLLMRWFSEDPLKRRWIPDADTYWEDPEEQPEEFDRYRNQF